MVHAERALQFGQPRRLELRMELHGWAISHGQGGSQVPHVHPIAQWSGVYYVRAIPAARARSRARTRPRPRAKHPGPSNQPYEAPATHPDPSPKALTPTGARAGARRVGGRRWVLARHGPAAGGHDGDAGRQRQAVHRGPHRVPHAGAAGALLEWHSNRRGGAGNPSRSRSSPQPQKPCPRTSRCSSPRGSRTASIGSRTARWTVASGAWRSLSMCTAGNARE